MKEEIYVSRDKIQCGDGLVIDSNGPSVKFGLSEEFVTKEEMEKYMEELMKKYDKVHEERKYQTVARGFRSKLNLIFY